MASHPRIRNIGVVVILALVYYIGVLITQAIVGTEPGVAPKAMLDVVSVPMLVFGMVLLAMLITDTMSAFWGGDRTRGATALYGLFLVVLSNDVMRTYGVSTRNIPSLAWLENTYIYSVAVYIAFIGLFFLSRATRAPEVDGKSSRWGGIAAGIVIGIVVGSSKMIEPAIAAIGRLLRF